MHIIIDSCGELIRRRKNYDLSYKRCKHGNEHVRTRRRKKKLKELMDKVIQNIILNLLLLLNYFVTELNSFSFLGLVSLGNKPILCT